MLVDYLEKTSQELSELTRKLHEVDQDYRKYFDKQLRQEVQTAKKELQKKKSEVYEEIAGRMQEIYLLRKYFPKLLDVLLEDEYVGQIVKKRSWLFDFKGMKKETIGREIAIVKAKRKELGEARDFLKKWVGRIDARSLIATWPSLKGSINSDLDKDEALVIIKEKDNELKRNGWLLMLNEPYILKILSKKVEKLRKATDEVVKLKTEVDKSKRNGTVAEYNAMKAFREAEKKRKRFERICRHIVFSNPEFLMKIKGQKSSWQSTKTNNFMTSFIKKLEFKVVKEEGWLREMRKRVSD